MGECACVGTGYFRTTVAGCPVHAPSQDSPEWVPWMLAHSAEFKAGYEVAHRTQSVEVHCGRLSSHDAHEYRDTIVVVRYCPGAPQEETPDG